MINPKIMSQKSTSILRKELYIYIEKILNRELTEEERQEISRIFKQGIKNYFESVYINNL